MVPLLLHVALDRVPIAISADMIVATVAIDTAVSIANNVNVAVPANGPLLLLLCQTPTWLPMLSPIMLPLKMLPVMMLPVMIVLNPTRWAMLLIIKALVFLSVINVVRLEVA